MKMKENKEQKPVENETENTELTVVKDCDILDMLKELSESERCVILTSSGGSINFHGNDWPTALIFIMGVMNGSPEVREFVKENIGRIERGEYEITIDLAGLPVKPTEDLKDGNKDKED